MRPKRRKSRETHTTSIINRVEDLIFDKELGPITCACRTRLSKASSSFVSNSPTQEGLGAGYCSGYEDRTPTTASPQTATPHEKMGNDAPRIKQAPSLASYDRPNTYTQPRDFDMVNANAMLAHAATSSPAYAVRPSANQYRQLYGERDMSTMMASNHDLAVLSAEQYDDGSGMAQRRLKRQHPETTLYGGIQISTAYGLAEQRSQPESGRGSKPVVQREEDDGEKGRRRKKAKLSYEDAAAAGEDDLSKRSRGRPRVDTKDETNADRRRTQIRMAQRAYRNRKETTISSLETQVQDLKSANEEMSNIFRNLYDFAQKRGVMEREPEFAQHLRSTKLQFLSLAKSAADENGKEDGSEGELQEISTLNAANYSQLQSGSMQSTLASSNDKPIISQPWGYQVDASSHSTSSNLEASNQDSKSQLQQLHQQQKPEKISRPTPENASFLFDIETDLLQFRAEIPDLPVSHQWSVDDILPMPKSYAYQETTFARRLMRESGEAAYRLVTSDPPHTERLLRVFGFVLNFESLDMIKARLLRRLNTKTKDALYDWRQPFVHLGGAGTYYPDFNESGISGDLHPKLQTGMSMGPHSAKVYETRDNMMEDPFRMKLDGYEGEYFDVSDVESYLRTRGIEFPPGADTIYIDLDQLWAFDFGDSFEESTISSRSVETPRCSPEPKQPQVMDIGFQDGNLDLDDAMNGTDANYPDRCGPYSMGFTDWGNDLNLANAPDQILAGPAAFHTKDAAGAGVLDAAYIPPAVSQDAMGSSKKKPRRVAAITATNLIIEMTRSMICLGRGPGIKAKDVDAALHRVLIRSVQGLPGPSFTPI